MNDTAAQPPETFRLSRSFRIQAVVTTAGNFVLGCGLAGSCFFGDWRSQGFVSRASMIRLGIFSAAVFGLFVTAGLYLLWTARRTRLVLDPHGVACTTAFTDRRIDWADIRSLRWTGRVNATTISLAGDGTVIRIGITLFNPPDRQRIVDRLRAAVPADRQHNWDMFGKRFPTVVAPSDR